MDIRKKTEEERTETIAELDDLRRQVSGPVIDKMIERSRRVGQLDMIIGMLRSVEQEPFGNIAKQTLAQPTPEPDQVPDQRQRHPVGFVRQRVLDILRANRHDGASVRLIQEASADMGDVLAESSVRVTLDKLVDAGEADRRGNVWFVNDPQQRQLEANS